MPKLKNWNATFWVIFKQCVNVANDRKKSCQMCLLGNFWVTLWSNDMRVCQEGRYLFTTIQRTKVTSTWNSEAVEEPIGGLSSSQGYVNPHSVRPLRYHYVLLIFTHRRNRALGNFHPKQLQYSRTEKSSLLEFLTSKGRLKITRRATFDGQAKSQSSLKAFNVVQRVSCTNKSSRIML